MDLPATTRVAAPGLVQAPSSSSPQARSRFALWSAIGLCLLACMTYAGTLWCDFINFDDDVYITENPLVRQGLSWQGIRYAFTSTETGNWIPLTRLSWELDASIFGLHAWGFHATNVLLHAANCVLLFLLVRHLTGAGGRALAVAALFAVHPLHVESVAWIAERKDVLSTLFLLLALLAYARYARQPGLGRYGAVVVCFLLGLMSKPMLVTLPILMLVLDYWPLRRFVSKANGVESPAIHPPRSTTWLIAEKLPLLLISMVIGLVTAAGQSEALADFERLPVIYRVGNAVAAYGWYLGKTFVPTRLCIVYAHPYQQLDWGQVALAACLLLPISGYAFRFRRSRPWLVVGWLWFLISLLPVIGIVQAGVQAYADRYAYVPHLGLLVMIVWEAGAWLSKLSRWPGLPVAVSLMAVALGTAGTMHQIPSWRTSETVWQRALAVDADNWFANYWMGRMLAKEEKFQAALPYLVKSYRLNPRSPSTSKVLGGVYDMLGDRQQAEHFLLIALRFLPRDEMVLRTLTQLKAESGEFAAATGYAVKFLALHPDDPEMQIYLGKIYASQQQHELAVSYFLAAGNNAPQDWKPHYFAALSLMKMNQVQPAITQLEETLRRAPGHAHAHFNLAILLESVGSLQAAREHYAMAAQLDPQDPDARDRLRSIDARLKEPGQ